MNTPIEILAPGGSLECIKAAIDSGADAVYFGGARFGARSGAVNLSNEQIIEAVQYAHLRFKRVYVTVNTLIADDELGDAFEFIKFCYGAGVDGVIVQDLGIVNMMGTYFPDMRLHASTQLTVHNLSGALQAQKMGFDRVVLSRELSFDEIRHIASNCDIELEVFVHGALCMSYSGQCLMSSFLGGRSGNRGSCAQPCRLAYTLMDSNGNQISEQGKYLLSLKDLCLIDYVSELKAAGVTSLKIEGRMKSEAYVSAVAGLYDKYRNGGTVASDDKRLLTDIFSRGGFTDGYYKGEYGRKMLSYSSNHDNIFSSATDDVIERARNFATKDYSIGVDAHFVMKAGHRPEFSVCYDGHTFSSKGDSIAEMAANAPVTAERITQQLSKLGGTVFSYNNLTVDADDGLYISVKDINNLRRSVFSDLQAYILGTNRQYKGADFSVIRPQKKSQTPILTASVITSEQAHMAYDLGFERIYVPYDVYTSDSKFFGSAPDVFVVKLPPVMHDTRPVDVGVIKTDAVCITNIGQLSVIPEGKTVYADYRLNTFNSLAIKQLMKMGVSGVTMSAELTIAQLKGIAMSIPCELVVYGRVSMMTVRNCLVRSSFGKCSCKRGEIYYLKDRKNICFPVICDKSSCTNVIYNSAPIVMSDRMKELDDIGASAYRFDFTTETPMEMEKIVTMYDKGKKSESFFTRGHYYNSVL